MILPIYIYGQSVLRKKATDIDPENYPGLDELFENMFETMYNADGVGIAAPQVGRDDRIFVVDLSPLASEEQPEFKDFKKVFINAHIVERSGDVEALEEGCLSIPGVHEKVPREDEIRRIQGLACYIVPDNRWWYCQSRSRFSCCASPYGTSYSDFCIITKQGRRDNEYIWT